MKRIARLAPLLVALACPALAAGQGGRIVQDTIRSVALERNLLGDSPVRNVSVYLPPGYERNPALRFPVIYLLHGYMGSNQMWNAFQITRLLDSAFIGGATREMIVVMPDGNNRYFGSFYTNSPVTGQWEDFLTGELVAHVDRKYRTVAGAASRGIAGHSMGGYGAIRLGMRYPDVFGAVYSLSACCLGWGSDFTLDNDAWNKAVGLTSPAEVRSAVDSLQKNLLGERWKDGFYAPAFTALAAAWSPNPDRPPLYVDLPVARRNGAREWNENVQARWSANMPLAMLGQYAANLLRLRGFAFDVGTRDEFPHIVPTARAFDEALKQNRIAHVYEEYDGDHGNRVAERIGSKVLPFFSSVLAVASAGGDADVSAIRAARQDQNGAIKSRDVARIASHWVDGVVVTAGLGSVLRGKDQYRAAFGADSNIVYERNAEAIQVNDRHPIAWEQGLWTGRVAGAGAPVIEGRYTAQWVKINGRWLIRSEVFVALRCAREACGWPVRVR